MRDKAGSFSSGYFQQRAPCSARFLNARPLTLNEVTIVALRRPSLVDRPDGSPVNVSC